MLQSQHLLKCIYICNTPCLFKACKLSAAGVQPRWIQGNSKVGTESASWKKLNYRYRGRLETDSVVGELMEKRNLNNWFTWNTNHHLRRPQASFHSPKGEEALRPPWSDLRSPGKVSRLGGYPHTRWEFSQENGERETNDTGESVFPETDPVSLFFRFVYIPFCYT